MTSRTRAAALGVLLALAAAPAAEAAPSADLRVTGVTGVPTSANRDTVIKAKGTVANKKGTRSAAGLVTFVLRTSRTAKNAQLLGLGHVKVVRGGQRRTFSARLTVPGSAPARDYVLLACVRVNTRNRCRVVQSKFTLRGAPTSPAPGSTGTRAPGASPGTTPGPAGSGTTTAQDTRSPSEKLRAAITADGLLAHERELQAIADANGNRAAGFQGYGASVQYVVSTLRAAGYTPQVQPFVFTLFTELELAELEQTAPTPTVYRNVDDETNQVGTFDFSGSGEVTAPVTPVDADPASATSGCEPTDFAGFPAGNVALIRRGTCTFGAKALNAQAAGAAAVIIFNQGNTPARSGPLAGTLGETLGVPVVGVPTAVGDDLRDAPTTVRVKTETTNQDRTTSNVIAETPGGDPNKVVVVGAHLDSVDEGPGINDNGSGSAFNLEAAIQMARQGIQPANKVRFAWWGAEENGLIGSTRYVGNLSAADAGKIALNLNFDMLGSPNFARFVYDGDGSGGPPFPAGGIPEGSDAIEKTFVDYFTAQGLATEPTAFDGRSDYGPFIAVDIPAGGLFSGAEGVKTDAQVPKFGGTAGLAYDPNYHMAGDTISNINPVGFEQLSDGAAHATATYATDPALTSPASAQPRSQRRATLKRRMAGTEYRGSKLQK